MKKMAWINVLGILGIFEGYSLPLIFSFTLLSSPSSYFFLSVNKEEKYPKSRNGLTMRFSPSQNTRKTSGKSRSIMEEGMMNECL